MYDPPGLPDDQFAVVGRLEFASVQLICLKVVICAFPFSFCLLLVFWDWGLWQEVRRGFPIVECCSLALSMSVDEALCKVEELNRAVHA